MSTELMKIKSIRVTELSLSELCQLFLASLNSIQAGMTDGYLSMMNSTDGAQSKSDSTAQQSQNVAITLAVMILNVEQISEIESLLQSNIIMEVKKIPLQFLENLEKLLSKYNFESIFNDLDNSYKMYSDKIEDAILTLASKRM